MAVTDGKMKELAISLVLIVITVCLFVSCSAKNSGSGDISTTAITDVNGETHYYETVTDENGETVTDNKGNTVYAEIVTNKSGEAATDKNKNYVTKENTTIFNNTEKDTSITETKKSDTADNEVNFNNPDESTTQKPTTNITNTKESTTQKETPTQSVTDKDGWINKWY